MIRLSYPSVEHGQRTRDFRTEVVRFGSDPRCDLPLSSREVAFNHGEFIERDESYVVVARDSRCLLWVNGQQVERVTLLGGERVQVGSRYGPVLHVVAITPHDKEERPRVSRGSAQPRLTGSQRRRSSSNQPRLSGSQPQRSTSATVQPQLDENGIPIDDQTIGLTPKQVAELQQRAVEADQERVHRRRRKRRRHSTRSSEVAAGGSSPTSSVLTRLPSKPPPEVGRAESHGEFTMAKFLRRPHLEVQRWLSHAQDEIQRARGGETESSGHTMIIFANALAGLRQTADKRTQQWRQKLIYVAVASLAVVVLLSGIIYYQQQRINRFVKEKAALDVQIQAVSLAMSDETDPKKLAELEAKLQVLMGNAAEKVLEVSRANAKKGGELQEPKDELERELRSLLRSFNAETYAIPPIFKETVAASVAELANSPGLRSNYIKKQKIWPLIQAALRSRELPAELGYITFTESRFEPTAVSPVGAVGMWQLMPATARSCGLTVNGKLDERYDASRSSEAAACYLSNLLVEFGQESFMLVLASYNRGENGVRGALHKVARDPGGWRKRDFWHLYRLKLLPDETRDYVPRILAAAVVFENPEKYGLKPIPQGQ